ncbi:Hypothetical predicted protein [Mytilus galloprovincialis]|uniref:Novel STAND NTPase 3 domain-containing protein n=1 Tax=Mytilus galloprovincialis TaxID=29158 RepID=A0A8B6FTM1_MYTGA|nr:Hypothetical predicted protein [Mytilus galloprovincialis]
MASNTLSQEEENYVRMSLLLTRISPRAVRVLFDKEFPPASLSFTVNDKNKKKKLNDLRVRRVINQAQWDLLFPSSAVESIFYKQGLVGSPVSQKWKAVLRLGGITMKQECDQLKAIPLDMSSQETLRNLNQANIDFQMIKQSIELIQIEHTEVQKDIKTLKSDHESLKKSNDVLQHEQAGSKQYIELVKADVTRIQIEQGSMGKSHKLLQFDHLDTKMDVLSLQLDNEMLKKSHDLLQVESVQTRTDLKELTSIHEECVPKNRRALIDQLLNEWQKNQDTLVETRAMKAVFEYVLERSCVTITASSGAGKTCTLRHVALKMKEEGYSILPVTHPNDIVQFCNPNQKTLFVIDDFCGTYSINQSDLKVGNQ